MTGIAVAPAGVGLGAWRPEGGLPAWVAGPEGLAALTRPLAAVATEAGWTVALDGETRLGAWPAAGEWPLVGWAAPLPVEALGSGSFKARWGLRRALLSGAMANGIASVAVVRAMAAEGMLGFFGAGGLPLAQVEAALAALAELPPELPWGMNLLHNPYEPEVEAATVARYLAAGVCRVEAAAYLDVNLPVVRFRLSGLHRGPDGALVVPNQVLAKVSREEVARRFLAPAPKKFLEALVAEGTLSPEQALWAEQVPVAADLTAEADSGGHTDARPALGLLPALQVAAREAQAASPWPGGRHVGLAGGISTPASVAAAFAMGADFVVTGSINQACVEAGTSEAVKAMLAQVRPADVAFAPAGDMFELGAKVQVVKRGSFFPQRANRLDALYRQHASWEAIPAAERAKVEQEIFAMPFEAVWQEVERYWGLRKPSELERAARDPKHHMALAFRWYLGLSGRWAITGEPSRRADAQVWCGPSMGAFNAWTAGSFLAAPEARSVALVGLNLMVGAAVALRARQLAWQGLAVPPEWGAPAPLAWPELRACLEGAC